MSDLSTTDTAVLPFDAEQLSMIISEVLAVYGESGPVDVSGLGAAEHYGARVVLNGHSQVEVIVAAPAPAAGALSTTYFGEVTSTSDLSDAMGELANVVGGAIKPFFEGTWVIGIPEIDNLDLQTTVAPTVAAAFFAGGQLTVAVAPLGTP